MTKQDFYVAYTDGGSRGNPGNAGFGVVVYDAKGKEVVRMKKSLGEATNNVAEYSALRELLLWAEKCTAITSGAITLIIKSDSELMVKQINGQYQVRDAKLKPLYDECYETLLWRIPRWQMVHIPRSQNKVADALANEAMDEYEHHT